MPQYPDQNNESFINRNYMGEILIIQLEHAILELASSKHYKKSQKLNKSTKHMHTNVMQMYMLYQIHFYDTTKYRNSPTPNHYSNLCHLILQTLLTMWHFILKHKMPSSFPISSFMYHYFLQSKNC